jgi:hypothetical protein
MLVKSLNADYGLPISELEAYMLCVDKILQHKIEEKPNSGVILNKGEENQIKLKYTQIREIHEKLHSYMSSEGLFSFGLCMTCGKWNNKGSSTGLYGMCGKDSTHAYHSCAEHTPIGAGFGLNTVRPTDKELKFAEKCLSCKYLSSKSSKCRNKHSEHYKQKRDKNSQRCDAWRYFA